ncbi:hypothetical protein IMZ48_25975, partial [Candidatus Bathyarchaeota archaeon]|nr:hypothetical protein [Candidatus Bathyarchaeota archaeon]
GNIEKRDGGGLYVKKKNIELFPERSGYGKLAWYPPWGPVYVNGWIGDLEWLRDAPVCPEVAGKNCYWAEVDWYPLLGNGWKVQRSGFLRSYGKYSSEPMAKRDEDEEDPDTGDEAKVDGSVINFHGKATITWYKPDGVHYYNRDVEAIQWYADDAPNCMFMVEGQLCYWAEVHLEGHKGSWLKPLSMMGWLKCYWIPGDPVDAPIEEDSRDMIDDSIEDARNKMDAWNEKAREKWGTSCNKDAWDKMDASVDKAWDKFDGATEDARDEMDACNEKAKVKRDEDTGAKVEVEAELEGTLKPMAKRDEDDEDKQDPTEDLDCKPESDTAAKEMVGYGELTHYLPSGPVYKQGWIGMLSWYPHDPQSCPDAAGTGKPCLWAEVNWVSANGHHREMAGFLEYYKLHESEEDAITMSTALAEAECKTKAKIAKAKAAKAKAGLKRDEDGIAGASTVVAGAKVEAGAESELTLEPRAAGLDWIGYGNLTWYLPGGPVHYENIWIGYVDWYSRDPQICPGAGDPQLCPQAACTGKPCMWAEIDYIRDGRVQRKSGFLKSYGTSWEPPRAKRDGDGIAGSSTAAMGNNTIAASNSTTAGAESPVAGSGGSNAMCSLVVAVAVMIWLL